MYWMSGVKSMCFRAQFLYVLRAFGFIYGIRIKFIYAENSFILNPFAGLNQKQLLWSSNLVKRICWHKERKVAEFASPTDDTRREREREKD